MIEIRKDIMEWYLKMKSQHFIATLYNLNELIQFYSEIGFKQVFNEHAGAGPQLEYMWRYVESYVLSTPTPKPPETLEKKRGPMKERICKMCQDEFMGTDNYCRKCRSIKQEARKVDCVCSSCGRGYHGRGHKCNTCYVKDKGVSIRMCNGCGKQVQGHNKWCTKCRYKRSKSKM